MAMVLIHLTSKHLLVLFTVHLCKLKVLEIPCQGTYYLTMELIDTPHVCHVLSTV